jgi:hypothetical protein
MYEEEITFQSLWMDEVSHIQVMDENYPRWQVWIGVEPITRFRKVKTMKN